MNRAEFESKLSDYVRGELSAAEARQIETYLTEHPEAADDLEAVRTVLELSADIGTAEPSDALFAATRTNALKAIQAADKRQRSGGILAAATEAGVPVRAGRHASWSDVRSALAGEHSGVGRGGRRGA